MANWWRRMANSIAFRFGYVASDVIHEAEYESAEGRQSRYAIHWAWYENQAYSRVHTWSQGYKHRYALSKNIRSLYNPAYRLGEFYSSHLWGGALDKEAGETGAIPIVTENDNLRPAIAELWQRSNMSVLKDIITLRGSIEGDALLEVIDDTERGRVYLNRLDPGLITECEFDTWGNVKSYTREETRLRPGAKSGTVQYKLVVSRNGANVVYETFLNGKPYAWDGQPALWEAPYTFIPLVLIKHQDVGLDWGWSELHPMRSKVHEVDNIASMLGDHIGLHLHPLWLGKGISKKDLATMSGATRDETGETDTRPQPDKEEYKVICTTSTDASMEAVVAELDVTSSLAHLNGLLEELERDYPELQADIWSTGATSGRALRIARQRVEAKVLQRREGYDSGLVRVQAMAIAIGGMRGYPGYEGFGIESYERGDLEHGIAERPVFTPDPMDASEEASLFWAAAGQAIKAGAPLEGYLREMKWSPERITEFMGIEEKANDEANSSSTIRS